jgi:16S rRNA (guanine527-N7)-methyltransferase
MKQRRSPSASSSGPPADLVADRAQALAICPVSRETVARLDRLVELLLAWQRTTNLIAPSTVPRIWTRHIADSLQLLRLAPGARHWLDLGSGGGFPGLVIAAALAEQSNAVIHLVESNGKKAAFLREAVRLLNLPASVHHRRIEDFVKSFERFPDVVTARALAPLVDLLDYAEIPLNRGAQGLFPKGQDVVAELTEASRYWKLDATMVPSVTEPGARIVIVRHAQRQPSTGKDSIEPTRSEFRS